ncbi:MAG: helix-hairpin-helix domain-containing protein [Hyphomicrobiaceae bacterium]
MQMLFLQTLGLLLAAYFVGAFLGCLLRRALFAGAPLEQPAPEVPEMMAPAPVPTTNFDAALSGPGTAAAAPPARVPAAAPAPKAAAPAPAVPAPATPIAAALGLPAAGGSSGQGSVSAMVAFPQPTAKADLRPADDLTLIRGIDAKTQSQLGAIGVVSFADIAAWTAADVAKVSAALGSKHRIASENWVEQAQVLAKGGITRFAREREGAPKLAQPTADEGAAKPVVPPMPAVSPRVEERAAFAPAAKEPARAMTTGAAAAAAAAVVAEAAAAVSRAAEASRPATGLRRDDLKRIAGISSEVEKQLNAQGIVQFTQIAVWEAADVAKFDRLLGRDGRIAGENWIEQAQILARGGATAYSRELDRQGDVIRPARLIDAIRDPASAAATPASETVRESRSDLSSLRSVRADFYRGNDGGPRPVEDLKRIRGVGVRIEKRLASMGITSYEQIANWSESEIDRVSQALDFKGRIERENWVEQARILATGGQTEFSRRVDRGEVETSKASAD